MRRIVFLILGLALSGCSVTPTPATSVTTPATPEIQAIEEPRLSDVKSLSKWEHNLLLNLWIHLVSEEFRLTRELIENPDEASAIRPVLITVKEQSDETWQLLFSSLR